ncbi:MAG: hypothetical protein AAF914_05215 [Pseudomonadota bacterium]
MTGKTDAPQPESDPKSADPDTLKSTAKQKPPRKKRPPEDDFDDLVNDLPV